VKNVGPPSEWTLVQNVNSAWNPNDTSTSYIGTKSAKFPTSDFGTLWASKPITWSTGSNDTKLGDISQNLL